MNNPESTCWTIIQGAAAGDPAAKEFFARHYSAVVRSYLTARWRSSPLQKEVEDAVQEVFVECFRQCGVLERVDQGRPGGFRAFFYGMVRNVALRMEATRTRAKELQAPSDLDLNAVAGSEESLSGVFDRAWAKALVREAAQRQTELARKKGADALRRVELLRLRFHEGKAIRDIAQMWHVDAGLLHHEYAKARQEFKAALLDVVAFHHPASSSQIEKECARLLELLS